MGSRATKTTVVLLSSLPVYPRRGLHFTFYAASRVPLCVRDAVEALSAEIKSLLAGPLKGRRTGVGELRKKMEEQSDAQVRDA